ncbi:MAG TPA: fasciclin domain-containing protein [Ktedonobacteraceae bacterium]|nr:fasciclin domain-containing protein [Ktedonobacteraceae bacterium]
MPVPIGGTDVAAVSSVALSYVASSTIAAEVRESIQINGANVLQANIQMDNGIIHIIDKVLFPPLTRL